MKNFNELSEEEKMKLFEVEELEDRLETSAWNDACTTSNSNCDSGCNEACPAK